MMRPIPKELPATTARKQVVDSLAGREIEHSHLTSQLLAADEAAKVTDLPDHFRLCFEHPGVKFYGHLHIGWRHRQSDSFPKGKLYWYQVYSDDQSRLHLEISRHMWIRGSNDEFVDHELGIGLPLPSLGALGEI
ncbi:hypothetical protein [Allorhodopirellula solitaria]|nr:hypothetical protein [Allorhodopirellula solitaria]